MQLIRKTKQFYVLIHDRTDSKLIYYRTFLYKFYPIELGWVLRFDQVLTCRGAGAGADVVYVNVKGNRNKEITSVFEANSV